MNYPSLKQVGEIIDVLYPYWSHFGNKEKLVIHHGEYDINKERHTDSTYTIQFIKCTDSNVEICIRFWDSGIQIWETEGKYTKVVTNTKQFDLYRYLKTNNLLQF